MYSRLPLRKTPNRKFIRLDLFSDRIQQGLPLLSNTSNTHWIWEEQPKYSGKLPKVAVKWQKFPDQYRKFLNFLNNHCTVAC